MVFGFDPRKLVEEDKEDKKKEVKEAVDSVLSFEEEAEKNEAFLCQLKFFFHHLKL